MAENRSDKWFRQFVQVAGPLVVCRIWLEVQSTTRAYLDHRFVLDFYRDVVFLVFCLLILLSLDSVVTRLVAQVNGVNCVMTTRKFAGAAVVGAGLAHFQSPWVEFTWRYIVLLLLLLPLKLYAFYVFVTLVSLIIAAHRWARRCRRDVHAQASDLPG